MIYSLQILLYMKPDPLKNKKKLLDLGVEQEIVPEKQAHSVQFRWQFYKNVMAVSQEKLNIYGECV